MMVAEPVVDLGSDPGRSSRVGQLPAHDHHEDKADQQEKQAGEPVEETDDLVVCREEMPEEQTEPSYNAARRLVASVAWVAE
jgi:hypothetical protein